MISFKLSNPQQLLKTQKQQITAAQKVELTQFKEEFDCQVIKMGYYNDFIQKINRIERIKEFTNPKWIESEKQSYLKYLEDNFRFIVDYLLKGKVYTVGQCIKIELWIEENNLLGWQLYRKQVSFLQSNYDMKLFTLRKKQIQKQAKDRQLIIKQKAQKIYNLQEAYIYFVRQKKINEKKLLIFFNNQTNKTQLHESWRIYFEQFNQVIKLLKIMIEPSWSLEKKEFYQSFLFQLYHHINQKVYKANVRTWGQHIAFLEYLKGKNVLGAVLYNMQLEILSNIQVDKLNQIYKHHAIQRPSLDQNSPLLGQDLNNKKTYLLDETLQYCTRCNKDLHSLTAMVEQSWTIQNKMDYTQYCLQLQKHINEEIMKKKYNFFGQHLKRVEYIKSKNPNGAQLYQVQLKKLQKRLKYKYCSYNNDIL